MSGIDIDRAEYFLENWRDVMLLERNGVDVGEDRREIREALAGESDDVRDRVNAAMKWQGLRRIRRALLSSNGWLRRRAWQLGLVDSVILQGEEWGFHDIVECARWIAQAKSLGLR